MPLSCPPGQIVRSSYNKPGYLRRSYKKASKKSSKKKTIKATYVSRSHISASCIQDQGQPGKSPKTLPQPDPGFHLSSSGYHLKNSQASRQKSLKRASKKKNSLKVLKKLVLINNLTASTQPENKERLKKDINFMKDLYKKEKEA